MERLKNYSSLNRLPRAGEGMAEINDRGDVGRDDEGKDAVDELDSDSKSARCSLLKGLPGKDVELAPAADFSKNRRLGRERPLAKGVEVLLLLPAFSSILFNDNDTEFMNESRFEGEAKGEPWTNDDPASKSRFNVVTERMESRL